MGGYEVLVAGGTLPSLAHSSLKAGSEGEGLYFSGSFNRWRHLWTCSLVIPVNYSALATETGLFPPRHGV